MTEYLRLSKGLRRHIRLQKAAIRRQFGDTPETGAKIKELVDTFAHAKMEPSKAEK